MCAMKLTIRLIKKEVKAALNLPADINYLKDIIDKANAMCIEKIADIISEEVGKNIKLEIYPHLSRTLNHLFGSYSEEDIQIGARELENRLGGIIDSILEEHKIDFQETVKLAAKKSITSFLHESLPHQISLQVKDLLSSISPEKEEQIQKIVLEYVAEKMTGHEL